jgi:hypothetical protein
MTTLETARWSGVALERSAETPRQSAILMPNDGGFSRVIPMTLRNAAVVSRDDVFAGARDAKRRL